VGDKLGGNACNTRRFVTLVAFTGAFAPDFSGLDVNDMGVCFKDFSQTLLILSLAAATSLMCKVLHSDKRNEHKSCDCV
jgi:hypothetical protein